MGQLLASSEIPAKSVALLDPHVGDRPEWRAGSTRAPSESIGESKLDECRFCFNKINGLLLLFGCFTAIVINDLKRPSGAFFIASVTPFVNHAAFFPQRSFIVEGFARGTLLS